MQSIPPTTADKQTQAQKRRGSRSRKLLGAKISSLIFYNADYYEFVPVRYVAIII